MKKNALTVALVAVLAVLAIIGCTQSMWITWVVMVPAVVIAMKLAIAIQYNEENNKEDEMNARIEELKMLIEVNTKEFAKIAHSSWKGTVRENALTEERHELFTELWSLEDALGN